MVSRITLQTCLLKYSFKGNNIFDDLLKSFEITLSPIIIMGLYCMLYHKINHDK